MAEMKSLTLAGKKYDSFVDQTAREGLEGKQDAGDYVKTVNGTAPDASGNVTVEAGGGGGEPVLLASITTEEDLTVLTLPTWEAARHVQLVCSFAGSSANTKEQAVNVDALFEDGNKWVATQHPYASRITGTQSSIIDIECGASDAAGAWQTYIRYAYGTNNSGSFIKHMSVQRAARVNGFSFNTLNMDGVIGAGTIVKVYKLG